MATGELSSEMERKDVFRTVPSPYKEQLIDISNALLDSIRYVERRRVSIDYESVTSLTHPLGRTGSR